MALPVGEGSGEASQELVSPPSQSMRAVGRARRRLMQAARREFARRGYAGATLSSIAGLAGLRKPSLFAHFATKDELYQVVVDECVGEFAAAIKAAVLEPTPEAAAKLVESLLAKDSTGAQLLFRELLDSRAPSVKVSARFDALVDLLRARWPELDAHVLLSFIALHLFWWCLPYGDGSVPDEHRGRVLGTLPGHPGGDGRGRLR